METTRQSKFARLMQKEISAVFLKDGKSFYGNAFVTITMVRVTPDLAQAKVYLSLFGIKEPEKVLEQLNEHGKEIRGLLGQRIRHQVRHVPEVIFFYDDSLDYADNIDKLLKKAQGGGGK